MKFPRLLSVRFPASVATPPAWPLSRATPFLVRTLKPLVAAMVSGLLIHTANAHFVEGFVYCTDSTSCPATPTTPMGGFPVTAKGEQGNSATVFTAPDGSYHIDLPEITQNYTLTVIIGSPLAVLCPPSGHIDFFLDVNVNDGQITGQNFAVTGCSTPPPECVCGSPSLGAASAYGLLQLGHGSVTITLGGVDGDVGVGPSGKFAISGSSFVSGTLFLAPGDSFSKSGSSIIGGLVKNADLSQAINDALATAAFDAALPCTQSFAKWDKPLTVTGNVGVNVICVGTVAMQAGDFVTLTGPAGAQFVVNVPGSFAMSGGSTIRVAGGVIPQDVVYNIIGTGNAVVINGGSAVDGSLLAAKRGVSLSIGVTHGQVISGGNVVIQSGAKVLCPCQ